MLNCKREEQWYSEKDTVDYLGFSNLNETITLNEKYIAKLFSRKRKCINGQDELLYIVEIYNQDTMIDSRYLQPSKKMEFVDHHIHFAKTMIDNWKYKTSK